MILKMSWQTILILILTVVEIQSVGKNKTFAFVGNPLAHFHPCKDSDNIVLVFEAGQPPGDENKYILNILEHLPASSQVNLKFDSEAYVTLISDSPSARVTVEGNDVFNFSFFKKASSLQIKVKGPDTGTVPYLQSAIINTVEYCEKPQVGYLDNLIIGYQNTAHTSLTLPDTSCGRRKIDFTPLIVNGQPTKPGDWPWHVAIFKLDGAVIKYICGGTLISKTVVMTAAHCATIRGDAVLPEILSVILGKYNLIGGDIDTQEKEVHEIIVHENYDHTKLNNDIALLKLKSEAVYNDYVQPACLWHINAYKRLPPGQIFGTVVGWGFDLSDQISQKLQQATMPKVSEAKCLKSNPVFFSKLLTSNKFCAGWNNGTSACNGDSGGGFVVFVPDKSGDASANATGSWHVRGIVSMSISRRNVALCDPYQYVLFTDTAKFNGWLAKYIKQDV